MLIHVYISSSLICTFSQRTEAILSTKKEGNKTCCFSPVKYQRKTSSPPLPCVSSRVSRLSSVLTSPLLPPLYLRKPATSITIMNSFNNDGNFLERMLAANKDKQSTPTPAQDDALKDPSKPSFSPSPSTKPPSPALKSFPPPPEENENHQQQQYYAQQQGYYPQQQQQHQQYGQFPYQQHLHQQYYQQQYAQYPYQQQQQYTRQPPPAPAPPSSSHAGDDTTPPAPPEDQTTHHPPPPSSKLPPSPYGPASSSPYGPPIHSNGQLHTSSQSPTSPESHKRPISGILSHITLLISHLSITLITALFIPKFYIDDYDCYHHSILTLASRHAQSYISLSYTTYSLTHSLHHVDQQPEAAKRSRFDQQPPPGQAPLQPSAPGIPSLPSSILLLPFVSSYSFLISSLSVLVWGRWPACSSNFLFIISIHTSTTLLIFPLLSLVHLSQLG